MENKYLNILRKIKSVSMATIDHLGHPQVRIIDVMLVKDNKLYFCTARGKDFYRELMETNRTAVLGMTENYQTIRLNGEVTPMIGNKNMIDKIFEQNPVMKEIYPGQSRYILEPFCIENGSIEYFDLSSSPIVRESSSIGTTCPSVNGFEITDACISCGICLTNCPQGCIQDGQKYSIQQEHCLHCGLCLELCPADAVIRRKEK